MPPKSPKSLKCGKCGEAMEEGYVARAWATYAGQPEIWVPGRAPALADFSVSEKRQRSKPRTVRSWRCTACGLLESYAG